MKNLLLIFTLFLICSSCFKEWNDPESSNALYSPSDKHVYEFGDTIYFSGDMISPVMEFNFSYLRMIDKSTQDTILNLECGTDWSFTHVNKVKKTTTYQVIYSILKEDATEEKVISDIEIVCKN